MTVPDILDWLSNATGENQVTLRPKRDRRMGAVLNLPGGARGETPQNSGVGSPKGCDDGGLDSATKKTSTEANKALQAGDVVDAAAKEQTLETKAAEGMTAPGTPVPDALK